RFQAPFREIGHPFQALDIAAAALGHHHVAERIDQWSLLLLGRGSEFFIGGGEGGRAVADRAEKGDSKERNEAGSHQIVLSRRALTMVSLAPLAGRGWGESPRGR